MFRDKDKLIQFLTILSVLLLCYHLFKNSRVVVSNHGELHPWKSCKVAKKECGGTIKIGSGDAGTEESTDTQEVRVQDVVMPPKKVLQKHSNRYVKGKNVPGLQNENLSLKACAEKCAQNPKCVSIDIADGGQKNGLCGFNTSNSKKKSKNWNNYQLKDRCNPGYGVTQPWTGNPYIMGECVKTDKKNKKKKRKVFGIF